MTSKLVELSNRVAALERRMAHQIKHAPVEEVDAERGMVRLNLGPGDDGDLLSPWIPYGQFAGKLKVHTPPTKGQNLTYIAPGGDPRQAVALPLTWSDEHASPSDRADENVVVYGGIKFTVRDGVLIISAGGFHLSVSGEGLAMSGGKVAHNQKDIGSTHKHPDVMPGPAETGTPVPSGPAPKS